MKLNNIYYSVVILTLWFFGCARAPEDTLDLGPVVGNLRVAAEQTLTGQRLLLLVDIVAPNLDVLDVRWSASHGSFQSSSTDSARWASPDSSVYVRIIVTAQDPSGNQDADTLRFWVNNRAPEINELRVSDGTVLNGNTVTLYGAASDPDSHAVTLRWSTPWGFLQSSVGNSVRWTVPDSTMHAWVALSAIDEYGAVSRDTLSLVVYTEIGCAWLINQGSQQVIKLSSIGDELLRIGGFTDLQDLDVDPENRRLWVCEGQPPVLHGYDLRGAEQVVVNSGFTRPTRLKARFRTGSVLVLDSDSAQIVEFSFFGDRIMRRISGLARPNALDLNQRNGDLWICDEGSNSLFHVGQGYDGDIADVINSPYVSRRDGYSFPVDVSVEDSTGACWLVDKEAGMLVRYEPNGIDSLVVTGFQNPVAVAATWAEGLCWVLDRGLNSRVLRYFFNQQQVEIGQLLFPKDLAFNRIDSHVWVLDTERNRVLRIRPDGAIAGSWTDFDFPTRIVINGGY